MFCCLQVGVKESTGRKAEDLFVVPQSCLLRNSKYSVACAHEFGAVVDTVEKSNAASQPVLQVEVGPR